MLNQILKPPSLLEGIPREVADTLSRFDNEPLLRCDYNDDGSEIPERRERARKYVYYQAMVRYYIKKKYGLRNYKSLVKSLTPGDIITVDPHILLARSSQELEESKDGKGITSGPVDVIVTDNDELVVHDGHHRLYNALKSNRNSIKIHVLEPFPFAFLNNEEKY